MTVTQLIFYAFAALAILGGTGVILSKNPVRSVLWLVFTFFVTAGIWMLLRAEFLSLVLVLVYVGAVMTLFLFVVMMLSVHIETIREGFVRYLPFGILIVAILVTISMAMLGPSHFGLMQVSAPGPAPADFNNITNLGMVLYTNYAYPFEIAAVVLLTAIIAAISLSHRPPHKRKIQNVADQIKVKPEDRLRIIKMASVPKPQTPGTEI